MRAVHQCLSCLFIFCWFLFAFKVIHIPENKLDGCLLHMLITGETAVNYLPMALEKSQWHH